MSSAKQRIEAVIGSQPEDSTYDEIIRELIFEGMVDRGMSDVRANRSVTNDEVERRIRTWQS